jgi:hypothetical protein
MPPRFGPGSGFLYVVTKRMVVNGVDQGPALHMVKETKWNNTWNAPGGQTDKSDHSAMHAALREYGEEVGSDWRKLANDHGHFELRRLSYIPKAKENWLLLVDMDAHEAELLLYGKNRTVDGRMNKYLSSETGGYAFVPIANLLLINTKTGEFQLDKYVVKLRSIEQTVKNVAKIAKILSIPVPNQPAPPAAAAPAAPPAAAPAALAPTPVPGTRELHGILLMITPPSHLMHGDVKKAVDSQRMWGGLHITLVGFAMRRAIARRFGNTPLYQNEETHNASLKDFVELAANTMRQNGPWHPKNISADHKGRPQLHVDSYYLRELETAAKAAGFAKVKKAREAHISIGNVKYTKDVITAVTHQDTRWTLGVAVLHTKGNYNQVVALSDAKSIWP